jgi:hypothetical protein
MHSLKNQKYKKLRVSRKNCVFFQKKDISTEGCLFG